MSLSDLTVEAFLILREAFFRASARNHPGR